MNLPVISLKDFYKADHRRQYPEGTSTVVSNWTPRKSRIARISKVVCFGIQAFVKEYWIRQFKENFFDVPKEEAVRKYKRRLDTSLGPDSVPVDHIEALWELGYLPLKIKAIREGSLVDIGVPMFTVRNTRPEFFWLPNDQESLISCELWKPMTSATIAFEYKKILIKYALETGGDLGFIQWQAHDFSMRGMSGVHDAMASGAGHLLSFTGTDTIPAIDWLEEYYGANADLELIGGSVFATEHSVMCMGTKDNEIGTFERLLFEIYKNAPVLSVVSDTWSLSNVVCKYLPLLKDRILQRPGKLVIRPDSGDPVKIICGNDTDRLEGYDEQAYVFYRKGLVEALWDIFGGTVNEKGFKVLNPKIGAIYGDSITMERCEEICKQLRDKGFASTNVVFGVGSYSYQYQTRDTFGFAMKATYGEVELFNDEGSYTDRRAIWKDPETDDGTKKSAKGLLRVIERLSMDGIRLKPSGYILRDNQTWFEENQGELETIFENGKMVKEYTLQQVRDRLNSYL